MQNQEGFQTCKSMAEILIKEQKVVPDMPVVVL